MTETLWTDWRVEKLRELHADGYSSARIAEIIGGGATKNAVIGKVYRLGLSVNRDDRVKKLRQYAKQKPKNVKTPIAKKHAKPPVREERHVPEHDRRDAGQLLDDQCRWPIGDPQQPGFHYCNAKKSPSSSYCEEHAAVSRRQDKPRARRQSVIKNNHPVKKRFEEIWRQ